MKPECQKKHKTANIVSLILIALLFIMFTTTTVTAEQLVVEYSFDRPEIESITIDGESYDRVFIYNAPRGGNIGQPALPTDGAHILLPLGTKVENIDVEYGEKIFLGDGYFIEPVTRPVKLSSPPGSAPALTLDPTIYQSAQPFPEKRFQNIGIQQFRGYQILILKLNPVEYVPSTGELYYYPKLSFTVNTVDANQEESLFRGLNDDYAQILDMVDNPEVAELINTTKNSQAGDYDLLIITTATLMPSFQPLKDFHDTTGIITEIHTTTDIGSTDPDDVRDYIRNQYLANGIQYVIIGADDDIIPAKNLYVRSWDGSEAEIEYEMPSDIYFACLDGTYNYDGDSYWGEPYDGEGGADVDLIAEIYIGRAAAGNTEEVDRFVNKTIQYLTSNDAYLNNILMVGEYLGFGGLSDYAKPMMEQNVDGSTADGYTTIGIPSDIYTVDDLYEQDYTWPQSDLTNYINNDLHVINHLGHGSPNYAMKLYDNDILNQLNNANHCLVYSQTCLAGHFDGTDCWAEYMNIKTDAGAFAVIMNARYGWGSGYTTDGPNQRFNREFWDAIFNPSEGNASIGRANHDSKEDNLYRVNESCMRWCYYEINLFGDPTISIRQARDLAFSYPEGIPETISPLETKSFTVVVTSVGSGVPVPGSGKLHYTINGGLVQTEDMFLVGINEYEATLPAVSCNDELLFYVSVDEAVNGTMYDPEPSSPWSIMVTSGINNVFEDHFETDKGWTVSGSVTAGDWNRGVPMGGGDRGDPPNDFDGSSFCYLTDSADDDSDVDGGTTTLTSPTIDLSSVDDALIHYARWYSNNYGADPNNDEMNIFISNNDGLSWTLVETVGPINQANGGWYEHSFYVTDYVTQTAQMKMRFDASDLGSGSVVEAALDDFQITVYSCDYGSELEIITTSLPGWTAGISYSEQLESNGGIGTITWIDKNNELLGTGLSISSSGLVSGTPLNSGLITFTAEVTDEMDSTAEQIYSFSINSAVEIATTSLPEWTAGISYTAQLTATGGSGSLIWSDKYGELGDAGLSLAPNGNLTGTAIVSGPINFTAKVSDVVNSTNEKALIININPAVTITTDSLLEGTNEVQYEVQLTASGGTGTL
ncbi:MAG: C25 family cysteine peptidase, partial [candidate division Zixibacteria bacterium]|nr:C25 family cysteine peptidase [candidate division Zixibacteria bacterium]